MAKAPNLVLDYQLGECIGKGGYGAVFQGIHINNGGFVAIKQIKISSIPKEQVGGIMTEIDLLKKLKHDNIVKYIGYSKTKEYLSIVLEFVESGSLAGIVQKFGKFPESLVRVYISQVLNGLVYLHEQGVIHRDIKGANILITKKGHVKLADFGVAVEKMHANDDAQTVVGTPYWMAPEIIELAGATPKSDIWSVGCTVIELLTGEPPYFDLAPMPALFRIVQDDHPPLPPDISSALKDFLLLTFQKDPLLRVEAKALLKHPWIRSTNKKNAEQIVNTTNFDDVQRNLKEYNNELSKRDKVSSIKATLESLMSMMPSSSTSSKPNQRNTKDSRGSSSSSSSKGRDSKENLRNQRENSKNQKRDDKKGSSEDSWDDIAWAPSPPPPKKQSPSSSSNKLKGSKNTPLKRSNDAAKKSNNNNKVIDDWDKEFESPLNVPRKSSSDPRSKKLIKKTPPKKDNSKLSKPKVSPGDKEIENWDDFDDSPVVQKKIVQSKPTIKDDVENWDDFDEPVIKKVNKPVVKDDDNWDDFDDEPKLKLPTLGSNKTVQPKPKAIAKATPIKNGDDNWDDLGNDFDFKSLPKNKTTSKNLLNNHIKNNNNNNKKIEDNNWDDFGDEIELKLPTTNNKNNNNNNNNNENDDFDDGFGEVNFAAKLTALKAHQKEEEVEEDEFEFDDIFDEEDFESGRDKFLGISNEILSLLTLLHPTQPDEIIQKTSNELISIFRGHTREKSRLIRHHGVIPIMEILEVTSTTNLQYILKLVNQIVEDNLEIQENLCLVGGIPTMLEFANIKYSKEIRLMAAQFVKQMCSSSTLTHQMFIACRGLPVLVGFLDTVNYREDKEFVLMAIDGIQSVFELQSPTPKNDFCRLFAKCDALKHISRSLVYLIQDQNTSEYISKVVEILLQFSSGDVVVKTRMADPSSGGPLQYMFQAMELLKPFAPQFLIILLKSIKQLSMHTNTLSPLQLVGAIPKLIGYFNCTSGKHAKEINNQVVNTLYNLTRIDRVRQEEAAVAGVIPHLQSFIRDNSPLKQFALGMLIDFSHLPKARSILSNYGGVAYFLQLLQIEEYWRGNLIDVISLWISDDSTVEGAILENVLSLENAFISTSNVMLANLVDPLLRICQSSLQIRKSLSTSSNFVSKLAERLCYNHSAVVMLNLLKIVASLFESHPKPSQFVQNHQLIPIIRQLTNDAQSILVQELASKLLLSFNLLSKMT